MPSRRAGRTTGAISDTSAVTSGWASFGSPWRSSSIPSAGAITSESESRNVWRQILFASSARGCPPS